MKAFQHALLTTTAMFVFSAGVATAQTAPAAEPAAAPADSGSGQLEEIVVTAQRKTERLQNVPISVNAVSAERLAARGITDTFALATAVPGLSITRTATVSTPYLRGVGANGADPNNEASVATYVDGVYYAAPFGNLFSFNNVERIEVLKGPQGTLFGRNATGGVIQIITRDPSTDPSIRMSVGYANYDTYSASGYATTGLAPDLAIDVAAQYQDQRDGWGRNRLLDIETKKGKEFAVRSKLLYTPGDNTRITLTGDYAYSKNSFNEYNRPKGVPNLDGVVRDFLGPYDVYTETPGLTKTRQYGVALRIEQDFDALRFASITARRISKGTNIFDYDSSPIGIVSPVGLFGKVKTWSQELQLMAPVGASVDWTVGGFYFDNKPSYNPGALCGVGVVPSGCVNLNGSQHTRSWSLYAQATVEVLPETKLTGGIRYTHEKQSFGGDTYTSDFPDGPATSPVTTVPTLYNKFEKPTWRIALDHAFTPDVHAYASYNRGIKSGGFGLQALGTPGFKPEILDAYEVGLKSELFDRHVRLNLAAFYYDYKDIQVTAIQNQVTQTFNAAGAHMKGLDADIEIAVTPQLRLTGGGSYVDGKYTDFPNPAVYPQSPFGAPVTLDNAKGKHTTRTPKFTGNAGFDYTIPSSVGKFVVSGNAYYNDGFYWEPANRFRQPSYWLLNGSLSWTSEDERFGARLWANNITNKHYLSQGVSSAVGDLLDYSAPRTYGLTLTTKF